MTIPSTLKTEVLQPVTTWIIPGSIAVAPYILVTSHYFPRVEPFWNTSSGAFFAIVAILVVAVGLILEDIGEHIEQLWDSILNCKAEDKGKDVTSTWHEYLKLNIKDEYIGQRYLRTILVRLKFELSMCPALVAFAVGLNWVNYLYGFWSTQSIIELTVFSVGIMSYMFYQSFDSVMLLDKIHRLILEAEKTKGQPSRDQLKAEGERTTDAQEMD